MRKSKAIKILEKQRIKLEDKKFNPDRKWVIQTQEYICHFFGNESPQYEFIKNLKFYYIGDGRETEEQIQNGIYKIRNNAIQFINDCMEIIKDKGIINQNHNFLEKINNQTLVTIIIFLVSGLLYVGYLFGTSTTDSKNVELRQENKQLKDSLSVRLSLDITNKKTK